VEEDVAGQVTVDQLTRRVDWLERGEHVVELGKVGLAPSNAVADSPWVGSRIDDRVRPGHVGKRRVQPLANGNDLAPAPFVVRAGHVLGCGPAVHGLRPRPGNPESVILDGREDVRLPSNLVRSPVERLKHERAGTPRAAGSTGQQPRFPIDPKDRENVCRRWINCHGRTRLDERRAGKLIVNLFYANMSALRGLALCPGGPSGALATIGEWPQRPPRRTSQT
jgi:hypothetical protein